MSFGSPTASSRAPPLLLFVIDNSCSVQVIHFTVLSHLLFYYFHIDRRLTWSWQLFNGPQKIPLEVNMDSLQEFIKDLECKLKTRVSYKTALTRALLDLKWEWNSVTARRFGAILSPPQLEKQKCNLDYKIRNHVFLISNLSIVKDFSVFKDLLIESNGKQSLLRTALIEKRSSLSIIDTQQKSLNNVFHSL